jgi:hypothetical protein
MCQATHTEAIAAAWVAQASATIWGALPERLILDRDSTVRTKYSHQEGAARGYNPVKPDRKSFHPLLAVGAGTRLCAAYRFRSGDTMTAKQWQAAMGDAQATLGGRQVWLNCGDLGLGHEAVMAWHEAASARSRYLFKLKLTANVRRALYALPESTRQGPGEAGVRPVAEARVRLPGWSAERRVVFARKLQAGSRRWFLVIAARLVASGRQKTLQLSTQGRWWEQLKAGYTRRVARLNCAAVENHAASSLPNPRLHSLKSYFNCAFRMKGVFGRKNRAGMRERRGPMTDRARYLAAFSAAVMPPGRQAPQPLTKKSLPLSSTKMNAGKSTTSIFHTASMPSSGYSSTSTCLMFSLARIAAGPPMLPR